ncbi:hypothetical protein EDD18DRAFT_1363949 [Armillaria luteobubalina]|uniref:JmjC domain-containing protein n=1 Tax=Armillaria luteobubalina TaxID=153913 RepID=A0AA39UB38_9AGAR|nr:hypothetical protein EDD18DRAFT_1363949 [Armillaria luteobubalina]
MSVKSFKIIDLMDEGRVLNTFSLPSPSNLFGDNPLHFTLVSHVPAFEGTVDLLSEEIFNPQYPCGAISFWTVSMKGAIHHIHSNSAGVGTVVKVVCGRQLFYIFWRSESTVNDSHIDEYLEDWAPGFIPDSDKWEAELVVLEPGLAFCMHPDMHYAVVTLENTIAKGHRFYTLLALKKLVSGWVHMSMLGSTITDDLHLEFQEVLLHMLSYFSVIICNRHDGLKSHNSDIHVTCYHLNSRFLLVITQYRKAILTGYNPWVITSRNPKVTTYYIQPIPSQKFMGTATSSFRK